MTTQQAIRAHGNEVSEETIGREDRLIGYSDGSYGWQARGSADVYFPADEDDSISARDRAIADYNAT